MTRDEYNAQVLPMVAQLWDRYTLPKGRVAAIWDRLERYPVGTVLYELRRLSRDDLDAIKPNWSVLLDRLADSGERAEFDGWTMADETRLAYLQDDYVRWGKNPPSIEYIVTRQMGRSMPTRDQRERAIAAIKATYTEAMQDDPNWVPTLANVRSRQRDFVSRYTHTREKAAEIAREKGMLKRWMRQDPAAEGDPAKLSLADFGLPAAQAQPVTEEVPF